jgi:hypothetical protein
MAICPLPIPFMCGSSKSECAAIEVQILEAAAERDLDIPTLADKPIITASVWSGVHEAILVHRRYRLQQFPDPEMILFRAYGSSRKEALELLLSKVQNLQKGKRG